MYSDFFIAEKFRKLESEEIISTFYFMNKQAILCFHDFSVENFRVAKEQICRMMEAAGAPISVAVIPSIAGASAADVQEFIAALDALKNAGHELLLHGMFHRASQNLLRNFFGKVACALTGNEAEFAGLLKEDSQKLFLQATQAWENLKQSSPQVFVPPTWYGNAFLKQQVLQTCAVYDGRSAIFWKDKKKFSPAISFAGLPKWSMKFLCLFAKILFQFSPGIPRLVFHPIDFQILGEKKITGLIRKMAAIRQLKQYDNVRK